MAKIQHNEDYRVLRRAAYPSLAELADAIVKQGDGDEGPLREYQAKCMAVKRRFPKGQAK